MSEPLHLEAALRKVEPALRLVPVRHLRKILHFLRDHGRAVPLNPQQPFWATRKELAAADVLAHSAFSGTEDPLLLITTPDDRALDALPQPELSREYWRLLFQAALMAGVDRQLAKGSLTVDDCEKRLARFGPAVVREIRYVLESEHLAEPGADSAAIYRAFVASYLDRHAFAPETIAEVFPSLPPAERVLEAIAQDSDSTSLLARSQPAGAAEARRAPAEDSALPSAVPTSNRAAGSLLSRAMEAEQKGNFVRAAILRTQAASSSAGENRELIEMGIRTALGKLIHELAGALNWPEETQRDWRHALAPMLEPAAAGTWPRAARCLYELQKIPSDVTREVFAVDLVEPIRTLGRRPIKRPLPHARSVMLLLKLRAAHKQLLRSGLDAPAQKTLDDLFHREMHRIAAEIRLNLSPIIATALTESGFRPANCIEEVAKDKIVAELLDRICERGYLRCGDLRDAIARNQLKIPDLGGLMELIAGDPLLRADTRLAYDLDGIYRRGEFYLRGLQRGSSLFFGTKPGRLVFLYLIAPFLAAFLTLTFAIELEHIGGKIYAFASKILAPKQVLRPISGAARSPTSDLPIIYSWDDDGSLVWSEVDEYGWDEEGNLYAIDHDDEYEWDDDGNLVSFDPDEFVEVAHSVVTSSARSAPAGSGTHHESALPTWEPVFVCGIFLLLVFHIPPFRRALFSVLGGLFQALRTLLWDLPARLLRSPAMVALRYSPPIRFASRYLSGAVLVAAAVVCLLWFFGAPPSRLLRWGGIVLAAATIALNTPWGWNIQERLAESISDGWRIVRVNLLPGFVATVLDWFRRLANWVERQLYGVDEWLRFRGGDSGGSLALKAILGLIWFPLAYIARFAFYLLIEPQINPVKHFPVVTVSHKVILPLTPNLAEALNVSNATALWLLAGVPGIFGFIAWELLANWRLYAANRPERLKPVVIGSHGESMRGLLRPGFHSGTVPKLFRKLRRASGNSSKVVRLQHDLHHAKEGVHRFVERELIALLERNPEVAGLQASVAQVEFGCQRVVVSIAASTSGTDCFAIAFENRDGRIAADIERVGWLDRLPAVQRSAVLAAVRGLLDMAAAELHQERERTPDADPDLSQTYRWEQWVQRWEGKR